MSAISTWAETWLAVVGYEGLYDVSDQGRIRSLYFDPPRVLSPTKDKDGYPVIMLYRNGRRSGSAIHVLVCRAFHGEKRNALHREVAHLDGTRTNCHSENLKWVSHIENHFHRRAHGTAPIGEAHPRAKLKTAQVLSIRQRGADTARALAAEYGVSPRTIADIRERKRWKHV